MFWKRFIVVLIGVPLLLWLILGTSVATFQIVSAIFILLASWEWACLMGVKTTFNKIVYTILILAGISIAQFIPFQYLLYIGAIWWLVAILLLWQFVRGKSKQRIIFLNGVFGFFCLIPCWVGLNSLRAGPEGAQILVLFLFLLWASDTGAYIFGKTFGKNKLAPTLSPGKTIEGVVGGLGLMFLFLVLGIWVFHIPDNKWLPLCIAAVVMNFFAIVGDLFESMFKRIANVKDSSHIIPGHGGILDRMDSALAAAPIFALAMLLINL